MPSELKPEPALVGDLQFPQGFVVSILPVERANARRVDRDILADLAQEIAHQRTPIAIFARWVRVELDCSDAGAVDETCVLIAAYRAWCSRLGIAQASQLSNSAWSDAMKAIGLPGRRGGLRSGCKLVGDIAATDDYADQSYFSRWLSEYCDLSDPEAREEATPLYQHFRQFVCTQDIAQGGVLTQTMFGLRLNEIGIWATSNNASGKKERVGVRLRRRAEATAR